MFLIVMSKLDNWLVFIQIFDISLDNTNTYVQRLQVINANLSLSKYLLEIRQR
jgi:hypothetical protein